MTNIKRLDSLSLICIQCGSSIERLDTSFVCTACSTTYSFPNHSQIHCLPNSKEHPSNIHTDFNLQLRNYFKKWSHVYYFIVYFFGPWLFTGLRAKQFLKNYTKQGMVIVDLGSGPHILREDVINVDIVPYSSVHIVADVGRLPFSDGSVDAIICEELLEHSTDPYAVFSEIERVLKPSGVAYFAVPFMYPYHSAPVDYTRWTDQGFTSLLHRYTLLDSGVLAGPFSALTSMICYIFALILSFNSEKLFWLMMNISIFIFFPIKLLDVVFARYAVSKNIAAALYYVAQKKIS